MNIVQELGLPSPRDSQSEVRLSIISCGILPGPHPCPLTTAPILLHPVAASLDHQSGDICAEPAIILQRGDAQSCEDLLVPKEFQ